MFESTLIDRVNSSFEINNSNDYDHYVDNAFKLFKPNELDSIQINNYNDFITETHIIYDSLSFLFEEYVNHKDDKDENYKLFFEFILKIILIHVIYNHYNTLPLAIKLANIKNENPQNRSIIIDFIPGKDYNVDLFDNIKTFNTKNNNSINYKISQFNNSYIKYYPFKLNTAKKLSKNNQNIKTIFLKFLNDKGDNINKYLSEIKNIIEILVIDDIDDINHDNYEQNELEITYDIMWEHTILLYCVYVIFINEKFL